MKCLLLYIIGNQKILLFHSKNDHLNKSFQILKISRFTKNIATKTLKLNFNGAGKKSVQNISSILQKIRVQYVLN